MEKLIKFGLILLLVSVPLFFQWHLGAGFYFSLYDEAKEVVVQLLILMLFCAWLIKLLWGETLRKQPDIFLKSLLIFFIFMFLSSLWATNHYESLRFIKRWASYTLLYFLIINNVRTVREAKVYIVAMVGTSLLVALYGIAQYFGWEFSHIYQTLTRNATLGNPSFAGWFLVTSLPLSFMMTISSSKKGARFFFFLATLILFIHLVVTQTRASWIGLTLALTVMFFFSLKKKFFRLRFILTIASILIFSNLFLTFITPAFVKDIVERLKPKQREYAYQVSPMPALLPSPEAMLLPEVAPLPKEMLQPPPLFKLKPGAPWWLERLATIFRWGYRTNHQRIVIWTAILKMLKDRPILGVGIGNFNLFYPFYQLNREAALAYGDHFIRQAHNEYLQFAAELGLVGLGLFIWFISVLLITLWRKIAQESAFRPIGLGLLGSFLATLVVAFFGFNLQTEATSLYFWFGAGLVGVFCSERTPPKQNAQDLISNRLPVYRHRGLVVIAILTILIFISREIYRPFLAYWHKQIGYCLSIKNNKMDIPELEKSVAIYPKSWEAQFILAGCYSNLNRYAQAEKAYLQSLRLNPGYAKTYYNLGNVYYHTGRINKAMEFYFKAIQINSYFQPAYHNIATIYYQRRDLSSALTYLYRGAVICYETGNLADATIDLRTCLDLNPQFKEAKQLLETIETQRK